MDSTGLLLHLLAKGFEVFGMSFDYGQKHKIELERLQTNLEYLRGQGHSISHRIVDLSMLGSLFHSALTDPSWDVPHGFYEEENMKQTVVPNRNAIFSSVAYGYALSVANRINSIDSGEEQGPKKNVALALGVHHGDHAIYPDCRPEFYQQLIHAFELGNWDSEQVSLYLPYLYGDKVTILQDAKQSIEKLGLDFELIFRNTLTSYEPDSQGRAHGETGSDVERILAFHQLGLTDPAPYVRSWDEVLKRALQIQKDAQTGKS